MSSKNSRPRCSAATSKRRSKPYSIRSFAPCYMGFAWTQRVGTHCTPKSKEKLKSVSNSLRKSADSASTLAPPSSSWPSSTTTSSCPSKSPEPKKAWPDGQRSTTRRLLSWAKSNLWFDLSYVQSRISALLESSLARLSKPRLTQITVCVPRITSGDRPVANQPLKPTVLVVLRVLSEAVQTCRLSHPTSQKVSIRLRSGEEIMPTVFRICEKCSYPIQDTLSGMGISIERTFK